MLKKFSASNIFHNKENAFRSSKCILQIYQERMSKNKNEWFSKTTYKFNLKRFMFNHTILYT